MREKGVDSSVHENEKTERNPLKWKRTRSSKQPWCKRRRKRCSRELITSKREEKEISKRSNKASCQHVSHWEEPCWNTSSPMQERKLSDQPEEREHADTDKISSEC